MFKMILKQVPIIYGRELYVCPYLTYNRVSLKQSPCSAVDPFVIITNVNTEILIKSSIFALFPIVVSNQNGVCECGYDMCGSGGVAGGGGGGDTCGPHTASPLSAADVMSPRLTHLQLRQFYCRRCNQRCIFLFHTNYCLGSKYVRNRFRFPFDQLTTARSQFAVTSDDVLITHRERSASINQRNNCSGAATPAQPPQQGRSAYSDHLWLPQAHSALHASPNQYPVVVWVSPHRAARAGPRYCYISERHLNMLNKRCLDVDART